MNKRAHRRFESHVEATLITPKGSSHTCYISDFSQEGLRVFWAEEEILELKSKDSLELEIKQDDVPTNIPVQCLFSDKNSAGFQLIQPNRELFLKLQHLNQASRSNGNLSDEKRTQYKNLFQQKVMMCGHNIIVQWTSELLDILFNEANGALNNTAQQNFYSAEKQIKTYQQQTERRFLSQLAEQLNRWLEARPALKHEKEKQDNNSQSLSLIQQDDFEVWLLTKVTTTHIQSKLSHASFEVLQILDMISEADPEDCFNPLGAASITEAFQIAIEPLKLDNTIRKIAFDTFEKIAILQLQTVYEWLIKQIVVPLAFRNRRRPVSAPKAEARESQSGVEPQVLPFDDNPYSHNDSMLGNRSSEQQRFTPQQAATKTINPNSAPISVDSSGAMSSFRKHHAEAEEAFRNIQNLLTMRYNGIEASSNSLTGDNDLPPAPPLAEPSQVQSVLQQLWQNASTENGHVRQDLEHALALQSVSLPIENKEALDTLEHVTQSLVVNKQVANFVKPFITDLEQPLSVMMLHDPSMMFNPQHPGRVALNSLSKLGKMTPTGQGGVKEKLEEMLKDIDSSSPYQELEQQFQELLVGVNTLLAEAERRAKMNADRVAQAAEGEHQVEQAKERVASLINKDTAGKILPTIALEWLKQGWKPLLTLLVLREGIDSKRFRGAIKLYRQVLSVFTPSNSGRAELLPKVTPLLHLMHRELDQLNGPQPDHTRWHNELSIAAEQHLKTGSIERVIEVPIEIEEQQPCLEGKGVRKAQNLQVGDWLLLVEQDLNVSVVWIADDGSKFACVNHGGMKVIDFTLEKLAAALEDGSVKRLYQQEESAVDQGLDALVQQIYSDLSEQANIDALTKISTRQHFMRHLKEESAKSHRSNLTHTLCLIDIDQFKLINSEYGVEGGDECLKAIAKKLRASSANKADCARMGSNEFAILFQHAAIKEGEEKAHLLKKQLEGMDIVSGSHTFRIHLSMGLAELNYQVRNEIDLVECAESASLLAKEDGGSRVYNYLENDDERIKRSKFMTWANKLNQALENNQLHILCLPVIAIQESEKNQIQYEVIISVEDEEGTHVPPLEYLQATENYSRMHLIDRWTLEQLINWISEHEEEANKIDRFMLKISGYSMNDDDLLAYITDQARNHNIPVNKLCFELNQTAAIRNIGDTADFMHEMRSLGCEFILSDFGTGQSSFEYLKQLPINYVKIDRSFINELSTSSADYAMVKSINEIAHFMAKKTIAEQVVNDETQNILCSIGIDLALGSELKDAISLTHLTEVI